ncbi:hypothetical protein [Methylobacterium sp. A54F]
MMRHPHLRPTRAILLASLFTLPAATMLPDPAAAAEDFTGFYAGVNAGYATGGGRDRGALVPAPGSAPSPGAADLPPSARDAAQALRSRDRGDRAPSPLR